jgi:hypothetical protein
MVYEDFTTFEVLDPPPDFTITTNQIIIDGVRRDATSYIRYDMGPKHFGDFEHLLQVEVTASDLSSISFCWAMTNGSTDLITARAANDGFNIRPYNTDVTLNQKRLYIEDHTAVAVDFYIIALDTEYFLTISRYGNKLQCIIYDDEARTNQLDVLTLSVDTNAYRWIFGTFGPNIGSVPDAEMSLVIKNLALRPMIGKEAYLNLSYDDDANEMFIPTRQIGDTMDVYMDTYSY